MRAYAQKENAVNRRFVSLLPRGHLRGRTILPFCLLAVFLGAGRERVWASPACPPDIDGDSLVTEADLGALQAALFSGSFRAAADANRDNRVTAGDVVLVAAAQGQVCAASSPTPTPSPSTPPTTSTVPAPTSTPTPPVPTPTFTSMQGGSPSVTPTPSPSPTPSRTPACTAVPLHSANLVGRLASTDCIRTISGVQRPSDAYELDVGANQEVALNVVTTDPNLLPYVIVSDPSGRFGVVQGKPPLSFTSIDATRYSITLGASADSPVELGNYQLETPTRDCPTPVILSVPGARSTSIDGDECADPYTPSFGTPRGLDVYQIPVNSLPLNLNITIRQLSAEDFLSPELTLFGPSETFLLDGFDNIDCTAEDDDRECAQIRLLAVDAGTYTLYAGGGRGRGRYTVTVGSAASCKTLALGPLPASGPLTCPDQAGPGCSGVWYGDLRKTPCASPLIEVEGTVPDIGGAADLYAFNGSVGDKVQLRLETGGDPYLYLMGPAAIGSPMIATATAPIAGAAEITAVLPVSGTYTVIAANGTFLDPPTVDDEGDQEAYTLLLQRAP